MPANATTTVIVNSSSGTGCPAEYERELEERFAAQGVQADVRLVHSGEAIVAAAKDAVAQGATCVVAAGGDGTVSAVASVLAGTGIALGVLPMGTLNHFAKDLRIPLELDDAIATIAGGREADVDVGEVNGRVFINNSSLGLYPDIVLDRERQRRRLGRGKWMALIAASLHAAKRYPVLSLALEVDGQPLHRQSAFVFIGNNAYTMEGFEVGERERLDEHVLSLYVTQRKGRFALLRLAIRALFRRLDQARDFDSVRAAHVTVQTRRNTLHVATDGEVVTLRTPLEYRIRPGALRVMVPTA
ncbi:diacylglycerol/lipid kinase family protein [Ramlibacter sp. PS4R-6]|uniref:diacylglycerol/lipid kinase family protein n=1 Tax=Ramlibacter sp. PS4R-6 TaxID=3133438 RepID=UPI0030A8463B